MTQEEKAKAYDEALERAKSVFPNNAKTELANAKARVLRHVFPELSESEDERIRKHIIQVLKDNFSGEDTNKCIAWLEKQGEQDILEDAVIDSNDDGLIADTIKQGKQKDLIIPKFREGEKVMLKPQFRMQNDDTPLQNTIREIVSIDKDGLYRCDNGFSFNIKDQDKYELVEQKPAWSEEDERHLNSIIKRTVAYGDSSIYGLIKGDIDWIKSIKYEVQSQPKHEWSEEDEKILNSLISSLTRISASTRTDSTSVNYTFSKEIDWLKSIRPQYTWKPSDEQMVQLSKYCPDNKALTSLYEQLKKLREE